MKDLPAKTFNGSDIELSGKILDQFSKTLRGRLVCPGDNEYDASRKIHNSMINRQPAAIVRCAAASDVLASIRFAREHNLLTTVRSGGHGVPGFAVDNGALMIDLSLARGVCVNPIRRAARADGGATWGYFDHETCAFGLATTGGLVRTTGIAGLTLAGGHGILVRKHGLACDNLLSVDVITADGRFVSASQSENEDLFWGLRGGGGNFGIVTSFEFRLHEIGPMLGGLVIYPFDQAKRILKFYHEFTATAPDELGSLTVLGTLPDGTKAVILLLGYCGPMDIGERVLRPLRTLGTPLADTVSALPYTALQSIVENFNPAGLRNYWKTSNVKNLDDSAIDRLVDHYRSVPAPHTHVVLYTLGGAVSRVSVDATAVEHRDARHAVLWIGMWGEASADETNIRWVRQGWTDFQPFSSDGFYPNYDADTSPEKVRNAYGPEKYRRLAALKAKYDPTNFFRRNQNISPAG